MTEYGEGHAEFHLAVLEASGNSRLAEFEPLVRISTQMQLTWYLRRNYGEGLKAPVHDATCIGNENHSKIFAAISSGDSRAAEHVAVQHIRASIKFLESVPAHEEAAKAEGRRAAGGPSVAHIAARSDGCHPRLFECRMRGWKHRGCPVRLTTIRRITRRWRRSNWTGSPETAPHLRSRCAPLSRPLRGAPRTARLARAGPRPDASLRGRARKGSPLRRDWQRRRLRHDSRGVHPGADTERGTPMTGTVAARSAA
jgi:hypothetical protein